MGRREIKTARRFEEPPNKMPFSLSLIAIAGQSFTHYELHAWKIMEASLIPAI